MNILFFLFVLKFVISTSHLDRDTSSIIDDFESDDCCCVCLDTFQDPKDPRAKAAFTCQHDQIHAKCLIKVLHSRTNRCPLCRASYSEQSPHGLKLDRAMRLAIKHGDEAYLQLGFMTYPVSAGKVDQLLDYALSVNQTRMIDYLLRIRGVPALQLERTDVDEMLESVVKRIVIEPSFQAYLPRVLDIEGIPFSAISFGLLESIKKHDRFMFQHLCNYIVDRRFSISPDQLGNVLRSLTNNPVWLVQFVTLFDKHFYFEDLVEVWNTTLQQTHPISFVQTVPVLQAVITRHADFWEIDRRVLVNNVKALILYAPIAALQSLLDPTLYPYDVVVEALAEYIRAVKDKDHVSRVTVWRELIASTYGHSVRQVRDDLETRLDLLASPPPLSESYMTRIHRKYLPSSL